MNEQNENIFEIDGDAGAPDFARIRKLMAEIKQLGYDRKTAAHFARLIDSSPNIDTDGSVLVMERDKVIARLKLNLVLKIEPRKKSGETD